MDFAYSHYRTDGPHAHEPLDGFGWLFSVQGKKVKTGSRRRLPVNSGEVLVIQSAYKKHKKARDFSSRSAGSVKGWDTVQQRRAADPEYDARMKAVISKQRSDAVKSRYAKAAALKLVKLQEHQEAATNGQTDNNKSGDIATNPACRQ